MPDGKDRADRRAPRVYVCAGPGGVGKTTVSAALAIALAQRGHKVAVVTIDPAKRLATALGLRELGGEPHRIEDAQLKAAGVCARGEMWAMTLDVKRTLDKLIGRLAPDERARQEILANRIYRNLSSAVAGSHEFSAMAKLYELHGEGDFDAIVLDTPPSRNALDFLDAPTRLQRFLGSRALSMFLGPSGLAARLLGRSTFLVFAAFARVAGVDLLSDLTSFFRSLAGTIDGLRERARGVDALLRDPDCTRFLIVTSPESHPAREAVALRRHLEAEQMPFGGLIVNRVHRYGLHGHEREQVSALLEDELGERLAARVAANLADYDVLARRDERSVAQLAEEVGDPAPTVIPQLDVEVADVESLSEVAAHLDVEAVERHLS